MNIKKIYMDYSATTPMHPEVLKEMQSYFIENFGNASSIHSMGRDAHEALEKSRETIAKLLKVKSSEIYFTSGGTESDNHAIKGTAFANSGKHLITSKIEHPAVLQPTQWLNNHGYETTYVGVDKYGWLNPEKIKKAIRKSMISKTILTSVMYANNEIGTIEPIPEIAEICKQKNVIMHTDAVQAYGKIPMDLSNIDLMSASSHKIYGPKGVGLLFIREGTKIEPFMHGGGQEKKMRGGTTNLAGIVGFAKATELAYAEMKEENNRLIKLRDRMIKEILEIPNATLNGHREKRMANNANFSFKGIEGESLLLMLDQKGVCASTGSACSSGSLKPSHVITSLHEEEEIQACGLTAVEKAHGSLRLTIGRETTLDDIEYVIKVVKESVEKLRKMTPIK